MGHLLEYIQENSDQYFPSIQIQKLVNTSKLDVMNQEQKDANLLLADSVILSDKHKKVMNSNNVFVIFDVAQIKNYKKIIDHSYYQKLTKHLIITADQVEDENGSSSDNESQFINPLCFNPFLRFSK